MPDPLLQEPGSQLTIPPRDSALLDAMRASQGLGLANQAPGYDFAQEPQDEESLATQYALAIPRGLEGMVKGLYNFADFATFDALPDWKKRLLGQSTHWSASLIEGLATYALPGAVAFKAFGAAQKGAGWAARAARLARGVAAGAVVDAVITDPESGRLSDWAKEAGVDWAVTNYLATDPDDGEATARFKNALEGILPGAVLDGVAEVFGAVRARRAGREGALDQRPVRRAMAALWREEFGFDHDQHAAVESFIEAAGLDRTKIRPASELPSSALFEVARIYHGADRAAFDALPLEVRETMVRQMREDGRSGLLNIQDFKTLREIGNGLGVKGTSHEILIERIGEAINARAGEALFQPGARAYTLFREDGTAFIGALKNPDLTSAIHELAHVARRQVFTDAGVAQSIGLAAGDVHTAARWAGALDGAGRIKWTEAAEEKFAAGLERYLRDGEAPSNALEGFFEKVATYFRRVYRTLSGTALDLDVTPEMRQVFDRLLKRGETLAESRTSVRAVARTTEGVAALTVRPETPMGQVELLLYSRDGDLRDLGGLAPVAGRGPGQDHLPGSLEARAAQAVENSLYLYRASLDSKKVLAVPQGKAPSAETLAKGGYQAWMEEGAGELHLVQPVRVVGLGASESKAGEVLAARAPGLRRALAKDADLLYQAGLKGGDAPELGNARFDTGAPREPINLDRIASPEGARRALYEALDGQSYRPQEQSLETARARAIEAYQDIADAQGEAVPHDIIKTLIGSSAAAVQQHADRLGAARNFLASLGQQQHERIKAATQGGVAKASDDDLVDILRGMQAIQAVTLEVRQVQTRFAQALGAQRIRFRGDLPAGKAWIPPRPEGAGATPPPGAVMPEPVPATAAPSVAAPPPIPPAKDLPASSTKAILDAHGGRAKVEKMIRQIEITMDANPGQLMPVSFRKSPFSMVSEYFINSILSGPITHAVNLTSGVLRTVVDPLERSMGAVLTGRPSQVGREMAELASHVTESLEAVKLAGLALRRDQALLIQEGGILEHRQVKAISALGQGKDPDTLGGKALDFLGSVVNIPSRLLVTEDELLKQVAYRSRFRRRLTEIALQKHAEPEARAEFVEKMLKASGEEGQSYSLESLHRRGEQLAAKNNIPADARKEYVAAYVRTHWDEDAHKAAQEARQIARERTFTEELSVERGSLGLTKRLIGTSFRDSVSKVGGLMAHATQQVPALRLIVPFVRTPTNILQWYLDRSVGAVSDLAAAMVSADVRKALTPQARQELAGRLAMGASLITVAAHYASQRDERGLPLLTGAGPTDPDERRAWEATGWRPYSVRVGDQYVSYNRLDPSSTFFGVVADLVQERAYSEMLNRQPEWGKALLVAVGNNLVSKTYLSCAVNLAQAIGEPARFGPRLFNTLAQAAAPFSSAVHQAVNPLRGDSVLHEIRSAGEAFRSRWIGADPKGLPVRRNVLGDPIERDKGVGGDPWSPLRYVQVKDDQIAEELIRTGAGFQPPRETSNGVDWTGYRNEAGQSAYDRWQEQTGQIKLGGRTLREEMARVIQSPGYQRLPVAGVDDLESPRVAALRRVMSRYREAARRQTFQEFPQLSADARKILLAVQTMKRGRSLAVGSAR